MCIVVMGISIITFTIVRVVPSNPATVYLGPKAQADQIAKLTEELGFDKPLPYQYGVYVQKLIKGDLGTSLRTHRPVADDIKEFLPNSLELIFLALFISVLIGIPLGVVSAKYKGKGLDHLTRVISIFGVSVPSFWIALILQLIFYTKLGFLPINGQMPVEISLNHPITRLSGFNLIDSVLTGNMVALRSMIPHYILPVVTLSLYPIGLITRMTRSNVLEILDSDYIRLVESYGISQLKMISTKNEPMME